MLKSPVASGRMVKLAYWDLVLVRGAREVRALVVFVAVFVQLPVWPKYPVFPLVLNFEVVVMTESLRLNGIRLKLLTGLYMR